LLLLVLPFRHKLRFRRVRRQPTAAGTTIQGSHTSQTGPSKMIAAGPAGILRAETISEKAFRMITGAGLTPTQGARPMCRSQVHSRFRPLRIFSPKPTVLTER
jgi:hypothetical protein